MYFEQDTPTLGTYIDSSVTYTVSFTGPIILLFSNVTCDSNRHCALIVDGSQLASNERYFIAVMASNAVGSGSSRTFPNQS